MIFPDVNVLLYAARSDFPDHNKYREWLEKVIKGPEPFAISELVLSSFVRIVTNARVFKNPTPTETAFAFVERIRATTIANVISPGPRHWALFAQLCAASAATGNLVPDAYFAALAIEHDLEWITTDRDYARFPGLRYRRPFA